MSHSERVLKALCVLRTTISLSGAIHPISRASEHHSRVLPTMMTPAPKIGAPIKSMMTHAPKIGAPIRMKMQPIRIHRNSRGFSPPQKIIKSFI